MRNKAFETGSRFGQPFDTESFDCHLILYAVSTKDATPNMNLLSSVIRSIRNSLGNEEYIVLPPDEREEAIRMLRNAVTEACDDGIVTAEEMNEIKSIQQKLDISDEELNEIKLEVLEDLIFKIKEDNIITDDEMELFESIRDGLRFSEGETHRLSEQIDKVIELYEERKQAEKVWEEGLTPEWRNIFEKAIKTAAEAGEELRLLDINSIIIEKEDPTPENLEPLQKLPHLKEVHILRPLKSMKGIEMLTDVEVLRISGSDINFKNLDGFKELENLKVLNLSYTDFEDLNGIAEKFPSLKDLNLAATEIRSIEGLSELREIEVLMLENTLIDSLKPLYGMSNLRMLNVEKCSKLSVQEVRQFYRIFPEVALFSNLTKKDLQSAFSPKEKAEALITRAERLISENHHREALTKLHLAIKKDSENADAYLLRAAAREKLGMYEEAAKDLRNALQIKENASAARHLAHLLSEKLLEPADAMRFADRAVKSDPNGYLNYLTRASILSSSAYKDFEQALEDNRKGLMLLTQTDKSSIRVYDKLLAEVYTNIGTCLLFLKRYDEAVEHLSDAVKLDQGQGQAYFNRGLVMLEKGNKFAARTDLEIARSLGVMESDSVVSKQF